MAVGIGKVYHSRLFADGCRQFSCPNEYRVSTFLNGKIRFRLLWQYYQTFFLGEFTFRCGRYVYQPFSQYLKGYLSCLSGVLRVNLHNHTILRPLYGRGAARRHQASGDDKEHIRLFHKLDYKNSIRLLLYYYILPQK